MTLSKLPLRQMATIVRLGGPRAFRRRLMELGLVPGTGIEVMRVAPLRDPLEVMVRGCRLSIRQSDADSLWVETSPAHERDARSQTVASATRRHHDGAREATSRRRPGQRLPLVHDDGDAQAPRPS